MSVDRFLATQSHVREGVPSDWNAITTELGVPCSEALVRLGRAMADRAIAFELDRYEYRMLTPDEAREEIAYMRSFPNDRVMQRASAMLPIFGQDGGVLLLAQDGSMHSYLADDPDVLLRVASDLEALVVETTPLEADRLRAITPAPRTNDVVATFLARQPPELCREAVHARWGTALRAWSDEWRALADELGIPCPPALVRLGSAMAEHEIYFRFADHSYSMLTPDDARAELAFMATFSEEPLLQRARTMLPLFGQDGDLLLLDREGAMHAYRHDDWQEMPCVARTLDDLLSRTRAAVVNV